MNRATDYSAYRAALVAYVRSACGLAQNRVMVAKPNVPIAARPQRPFCTIGWRGVGRQIGRDWVERNPDNLAQEMYRGTRTMNVDFDFYADTPEEAFDLASTAQAALRATSIARPLYEAGLSAWGRDPILDLSALVNTAYEGRARMGVQFAYSTCLTIDVDYIEQASVVGTASGQGLTETISFTANLAEGS